MKSPTLSPMCGTFHANKNSVFVLDFWGAFSLYATQQRITYFGGWDERGGGGRRGVSRIFQGCFCPPFPKPGESARTLIRAFFPPPCLCLWGKGEGEGGAVKCDKSPTYVLGSLPLFSPGERRSGHPPPEKGEEVGGKKGGRG